LILRPEVAFRQAAKVWAACQPENTTLNPLRSIRGFIPYTVVLFLNAFVDLGHKIVIQNTVFKVFDGQVQIILTAIVNALILLPFILLFTPAGFLADKYPKDKVIKVSAVAAIAITLLITLGYYQGWFEFAFAMTLLLGAQAAFYSPAKYGFIKELVGNERLAAANGVVQATTICGILLGTFVFSALFETLLTKHIGKDPAAVVQAIAPLGWILVGLSIIETAFAFGLPALRELDVGKRFDTGSYLKMAYLQSNLRVLRGKQAIWLSIIGLATFWGISQVMLAAFPAFAKDSLSVTNTVVIQGVLACSGVGIVIGSLIAGRLSRNYIETGLIPVGALGITVLLALLPSVDSMGTMAVVFLIIGIMGGMFIIPLNSLIQFHAPEKELGIVLAGNNWIQNITMLAFLVVTVLFAWFGIDSLGLFLMLTVVALVGTGYTVSKLPHSFARIIASVILRQRYRLDVVGFGNMPASGPVLLLGNHISWIDWALVQVACPRPIRFVMQRQIFELWFLKPIFKAFGAVPIASGQSADSLRTVNALLKNGEVVCLFPEGAISRNGHLGKFHRGYERTVEGVENGVIIPFYLRGLWGSAWSRANEGLRNARASALRRDIVVAFGEPRAIDTPAEVLKQHVFELSISAWENYADTLHPIPLTWIRTVKRNPGGSAIVDAAGQELSNIRTLAASLLFARRLRSACADSAIGILLPASAGAAIANMAVLMNGQPVVNLNFTAGSAAMRAAVERAGIRTVLCSRQFELRLQKRGIDLGEPLAGVTMLYMEELRAAMRTWELFVAAAAALLLPASLLLRAAGKPVELSAPAAILFSSGSEGSPKGIVLSHRNIVANCKQISDVLNTREDDVVLASLPPFHSFGLTVTTFLPLLEGIPMVCHPDATDVLGTAKAIAKHRATILCATGTFLRLYTRNTKVDPLMLESLRVVVAGAERLTETIRHDFEIKFHKTIYEGYGCTETTPVASVNMPDAIDTNFWRVQYGNRPGSVGMPLPGTAFRIIDPETLTDLPLESDGEICISGAQVMIGYLNEPERTQKAFITREGRRWYRTGDKGHLTEDGFLIIVDRYSRFAKIGGEMISLRAVEDKARAALNDPDIELVAVTVPDGKKGERIAMLVAGGASADTISEKLIAAGIEPLYLPEVIAVSEVPKLGTGKTDYATAKAVAVADTVSA
jgi:acyl-[acyl-carrier-protein]-phospholipid O-acyltransferase / long-chain-fatty-acid--[acyl-carrier-protein] ligase